MGKQAVVKLGSFKKRLESEAVQFMYLTGLDFQVGTWAYLAQSLSPMQGHFSPTFVS